MLEKSDILVNCTKRSMAPKARAGIGVRHLRSKIPALDASLSKGHRQTEFRRVAREGDCSHVPQGTQDLNVEGRSQRDPKGCVQTWEGPRGVKTVRTTLRILTHRAGTQLPGRPGASLNPRGVVIRFRCQRLDWRNSGFPPPSVAQSCH